jgi:hypothetical protein
MNERIKQITGQVLDELVPETWVALGYDKIKEIQNRTAELIVQECAKVADIADENKCEWIGGNILTHFGVEDRAVPILSADEEALLSGITSSKLFTIEAAKKAFGVKE